MVNVLDRARRTIRQHQLARPDTHVLAALSGGSDSVALVHLLHTLHGAGELHLAGIAHFNHQLRASADSDEEFSRNVAASLDVPFFCGREHVATRARRGHESLELAARTARHAFLERTRIDANADVVALGHTRDDQAETFLLRLVRGAGTRGLAAMHPRNGVVIRPLLDCRRDELCAYLAARQLSFVHDESNDDVSIPRNRVRAELLPLLRDRLNPSVVDALAQEAEIAREEWEWLRDQATKLHRLAVRPNGNQWTINTTVLRGAPAAVVRLMLKELLADVAPNQAGGFSEVERVRALCMEGGPPFDASGQRVERFGSEVVLTGRPWEQSRRSARDSSAPNFFWHTLSIPGEVKLPQSGAIVSAEEARFGDATRAIACSSGVAAVRRDRCVGGLAVRTRRAGDRFQPLGLNGHKKLQDFFVDKKVAREHRDAVPLVVNHEDRIVWVAGHSIDEQFRVTDPAQAVIILRLKAVGGSV